MSNVLTFPVSCSVFSVLSVIESEALQNKTFFVTQQDLEVVAVWLLKKVWNGF